ncbi:methylthioribose kinase-like isoform X2 [Branchiostoma floridae]|uniref:Methylthioribose kinase-like isoform X2 n=1 Tax=Branchiostoma floridae TaxID=7739 RepID=A0A9J7MIK4_BRAFL|nr:methylthioribose kinase-like isoform X2 [Branchiostoma floridae]
MNGTIMDKDSLLHVLRKHAMHTSCLKFVEGACDVTEVGDGNMNHVFRVAHKQDSTSSVIVKAAPPYIKCLGPDYPLTVHRCTIEYRALQKFHEIIPGYSPQPYLLIYDMSMFVMEDLSEGYVILQAELIRGKLHLAAVRNIAVFMARVHSATGHRSPNSELLTSFSNPDMVSLTEQYIFTRPFLKDDPTNHSSEPIKAILHLVHDDRELQSIVGKFKRLFLEKQESLVHGDLHSGSILVRPTDGGVKVIDAEFAYIGPSALDLGLLLASYVFSYSAHKEKGNDGGDMTFCELLCQAIHLTGETYTAHLTSQENATLHFSQLMPEVAGFAGCELIRRIIGAAHVADVEGCPAAEERALRAGIWLLKNNNTVTSTTAFLRCLQS